jgi:hypothetical protein
MIIYWATYASNGYEADYIEYLPECYMSDKMLLILTFGIVVFPPLVVPYWIIKSIVKNIYKMVKHIVKVFKSDTPWFI